MCSEGKAMTEPMIIEKAKCFYDEKKITDKCTFSESNKTLPVIKDQHTYCQKIQNI
jgi:hypothetical protein